MKSNISDKCYVYFDIYVLPVINNVNFSKIDESEDGLNDGSIIINNILSTSGTNPIVTYEYFLNDQAVTVYNNTITGLAPGSYVFTIHAVDSKGYKSESYSIKISIAAGSPTDYF